MPWFDLPLNQLREYRTETAEPPELDLWWQRRLEEARAVAQPPTLTRYEADIYAPVEVYDTEFSGAGGDRIRARHLRPAAADGQTPVVVKFIGFPQSFAGGHIRRRSGTTVRTGISGSGFPRWGRTRHPDHRAPGRSAGNH